MAINVGKLLGKIIGKKSTSTSGEELADASYAATTSTSIKSGVRSSASAKTDTELYKEYNTEKYLSRGDTDSALKTGWSTGYSKVDSGLINNPYTKTTPTKSGSANTVVEKNTAANTTSAKSSEGKWEISEPTKSSKTSKNVVKTVGNVLGVAGAATGVAAAITGVTSLLNSSSSTNNSNLVIDDKNGKKNLGDGDWKVLQHGGQGGQTNPYSPSSTSGTGSGSWYYDASSEGSGSDPGESGSSSVTIEDAESILPFVLIGLGVIAAVTYFGKNGKKSGKHTKRGRKA